MVKKNLWYKFKLFYVICFIVLSVLLISSAGCVSTPTKLDDNFYKSIRQIGTSVDNLYYFKLPNGISVYLYNQPKNETDVDADNYYKTTWISYIFGNLALAMTDLPAGTQYALADILYYIPGKKYDSDKFEKLYNSGYLNSFDYEMTEDYYRIRISGSPSYFNTLLTDIPVDILNKSIPQNIDYKSLAKSYNDFLKKKEYDLNWLVYRLAEKNAFQNTIYSHVLDTPQTYAYLSQSNVSRLYKRLIQPKNLTIIIRSSKLNPQAAANILWEKFQFMKNTNQDIDKLTFTAIDATKLNKNNFAYQVVKDTKNSIIAGYFPGPLSSSEEIQAFVIALNILSKKLFINVRIRNNNAYSIDAFPYFLKQSWGNILYNTTDVNSSMKIVRQTINELKEKGISDEDLEGFRNYIFTIYYLYQSYGKDKFSLFFNSIVRYNEDLDKYYINYLKTFQSVTKESVNNCIKKYFNYFYWGLVAPSDDVVRNLPKDLFFFNP